MLIRCMSDTHLEFSEGRMNVPKLPTDRETVLVLAGDIGVAKSQYTYKWFIEEMSDRFRAVVYVMGNHEHYKGNFPTTYAKIWNELLEYDNVHVLDKEWICLDGVAFIGATLWTNMGNHDSLTIEQARLMMRDYKKIRTGPMSEPWKKHLHPHDTISEFMNAKHFIFEEIKTQKARGKKVVVVSHHAPSYLSVSNEFKADPHNGMYVSELFEDIMDLEGAQPELWCHGHLHNNVDYKIGNTRVVCNPRGYLTRDPTDLNSDFDVNLVIEV